MKEYADIKSKIIYETWQEVHLLLLLIMNLFIFSAILHEHIQTIKMYYQRKMAFHIQVFITEVYKSYSKKYNFILKWYPPGNKSIREL